MKDSNGRESKTLMFVTVAFLILCAAAVKIIWVGTADEIGGHLWQFGAAVSGVLAPWLTREWVKK
jgi:hypothetical protein